MSLLTDLFLINNSLDCVNVVVGGTLCITGITCRLSQFLSSFFSLKKHLFLVLGNIHHHFIDVGISKLYVVSGLLTSGALRLFCHPEIQ